MMINLFSDCMHFESWQAALLALYSTISQWCVAGWLLSGGCPEGLRNRLKRFSRALTRSCRSSTCNTSMPKSWRYKLHFITFKGFFVQMHLWPPSVTRLYFVSADNIRCKWGHRHHVFHLLWTCNCGVGDAVRDAGDRSGRLAEEHHLQTLRSQQQTDRLVLAGQTSVLVSHFSIRPLVKLNPDLHRCGDPVILVLVMQHLLSVCG